MPGMSDKKKPSKIKARLPRGLKDSGPAELSATREMVEKIRKVYELYGFEAVETPAIEYTETLGKFLPDTDRPNEGVFSFQDDDEQWMSLRYDLTAPLARYVAENFETLPKPYRSYRVGWVYRNEKPGPGRYRQFMQFDADTVGAASVAADAEMCMMAADTMEALGIKRGDYVIKVNNRKLLDGVMESIGLSGAEYNGQRLTVLRALDKLDRLGVSAVEELLGKGRKDESGDFTKGAQLSPPQIGAFAVFLTYRPAQIVREPKTQKLAVKTVVLTEDKKTEFRQPNNANTIENLKIALPSNSLIEEGVEGLKEISSLIESSGYGDRVIVDPSVVRGLEYYTGPIYEVELIAETKDEKGNPVRFGSVGGGGRYDGLVARFRGEPVPATGFSIGVSRLLAALQTLGKAGTEAEQGPVVVTLFHGQEVQDAQRFVKQLRDQKIRAELYLGNPKNFGNQLKYADKRNAPCAIIQGPDEKNDPAGPQIIVKDLTVGAELAKLEKGRDEYLQKQAGAQRKVPEADLVKAVREVLARHKG
jgi:histidyl-tRNA synthetase